MPAKPRFQQFESESWKHAQNTNEHIDLEAFGYKYKTNKCVGCKLTGHTAQNDDVINSRRKETVSKGVTMLTFSVLPAACFYSRVHNQRQRIREKLCM